jgi:hypothetical protein
VSWRFDFDYSLPATGVHFAPLVTPANDRWNLMISDTGKKSIASAVSNRLSRGEHVLAADLLFYGDAAPPPLYYPVYDRMMATLGERSLGIEAAQLIAIARWLREHNGARHIRLCSTGLRTQAVALVAAALDRELFSELSIEGGLESWNTVFDKPVAYQDGPELLCLDLYRYFDIDQLSAAARLPEKLQR